MDLSEDRLQLSRELSELDKEVLEFVGILEDCGIEYVIVSGYIAILTGRSRATEVIDIVLEPLSQQTTDELVETLTEKGYWGMAMPLEDMYSMLSSGERIRIAEDGEMIPNLEVWFANNAVEREALNEALTAELGATQLTISPLELQLAYKLRLAQHAGSSSGKDFEDALHLYETFAETSRSGRASTSRGHDTNVAALSTSRLIEYTLLNLRHSLTLLLGRPTHRPEIRLRSLGLLYSQNYVSPPNILHHKDF